MSSARKRVVIIGGGTGGAVLANRLPRDEFEVTVIDRQPYNYYWPWLLYIAFRGSKKPIRREIRSVLKPWVNFIQSSVNVINLQDRYVEFDNGKRLEYDYVVIATGATVDYSRIPGLDKVTEEFGDYHSNEANAWRVWHTLNRMREGTLAIILAPGAYRCPPSPLEGVFLAEEFFKRRNLRDRVRITFATFYPRPYPAEPMNELIEPLLKERGIDYITFYTLDHIDPEKRVAYSMEGEELKFDSAIVIPPHVGAGIKYVPGDVLDSDGFVQADKFTNRVKGFDDAFVIGDASALPISKTGVTAHLEAFVVASILQGEDARNTGRTNCPFDVGYGLGTFVISDFYNPVIKYPINRINHLLKITFAATYWDTLLYPELWDPILESFFEATEPARLRQLYR